MFVKQPLDRANGPIDQAAVSADRTIHSTERTTRDTLEALSESAQDMRNQAASLLNRGGDQMGALAQRGVDAVRDRSQLLREKALRASDSTVGYIKDEPVKAVLIAAAAGAALMALLGLMSRARARN